MATTRRRWTKRIGHRFDVRVTHSAVPADVLHGLCHRHPRCPTNVPRHPAAHESDMDGSKSGGNLSDWFSDTFRGSTSSSKKLVKSLTSVEPMPAMAEGPASSTSQPPPQAQPRALARCKSSVAEKQIVWDAADERRQSLSHPGRSSSWKEDHLDA